jgi:hypothetical protein
MGVAAFGARKVTDRLEIDSNLQGAEGYGTHGGSTGEGIEGLHQVRWK